MYVKGFLFMTQSFEVFQLSFVPVPLKSQTVRQAVENNAVWLRHFDFLSVHDKQPFFQIYIEESHRIRLVIQ